MEHRIAQKKLMFYHHIISLPAYSLAYEIAATQVKCSYPGLMIECQELVDKYNLPEVKQCSKLQWKKEVINKVKEMNENSLIEIVETKYKKLDHKEMKKETCKTKEYMKSLNLPDARLKFSLRARMTRTVQMNYKGDPKFKKNNWKCHDCCIVDTQEHILRCPSYQSLRTGKNLRKDKDLVDYFRKVIKIREKEDEERQE